MIPFSKPTLNKEEDEAVLRILHSNWLAAGKETEAFEQEFSDYISPNGEHYYCIFTNSGTSALKMAYKYLDSKGLRKLYIPKNTFCATYAAAVESGLEYTHDPEQFTDGDVRVWYGGIKRDNPLDEEEYEDENLDKEFIMVEDSAHRIEQNDLLIGKIRCYSFYVTKNMTTGAGGMFVTNEKEIYDTARTYWRDGLTTSTADRAAGNINYRVESYAGGYDGNDLTASIGRCQLRKLPAFTEARNRIRDRYNQELEQTWAGNHLYPFFLKEATQIPQAARFFQSHDIGVGYHYPKTGWHGLSLPIYPLLSDKEQDYIIQTAKSWREQEK